tara:strand:- start:1937 stop:2161 length:225 start_codon:yes stop_codon:yes gene_type:complete
MESTNDVVAPDAEVQKSVKLVDIPVTDESLALTIIVQYINLAHKRGSFSIDEAAKIWECIKWFQKPKTEEVTPE